MDCADSVLRIEWDDEKYLKVIVFDEAFCNTERGLGGRCLEGDIRFVDLLVNTGDFNKFCQFYGKA